MEAEYEQYMAEQEHEQAMAEQEAEAYQKMMEDKADYQYEKNRVSENMIKYGGGFVKALGEALSHADINNTMRIKQAFSEYWERYKDYGNK